jgi:hypothetical protein
LFFGAVSLTPTVALAGVREPVLVGGTAKAPPGPEVKSFAAMPTSLDAAGGDVRLAGTVENATRCVVYVRPDVRNLPTSFSCGSGAIQQTVLLPANTTKHTVSYDFWLDAFGIGPPARSATITVSVAAAAASVRIAPNVAATVTGLGAASGVTLKIPADAFPHGATISINAVAMPDSTAPRGAVGPAFSLIASSEPVIPVALSMSYDPARNGPAGDVTLASWDANSGSWIPVATTYAVGSEALVASIPHFSTWSWVSTDLLTNPCDRTRLQAAPAATHST